MTDDEDLGQLLRTCATLPLPEAIDFIEQRLPAGLRIEVLLWDYQRRAATGLRSGQVVDRDHLDLPVEEGYAVRPIDVQGDNLGRLVIGGSPPDGSALSADFIDRLADLVAMSIRASEQVADTVAIRRRTKPMSLPAEMQWKVLPPGQFIGGGARVSAAVEPAYDTGGDVFDYAVANGRLFVAVLDARGHGLRAATTAAVTTSAMRRSRRSGDDLLAIAEEMHGSIGSLGYEEDFVSAVLVDLDLETWSGHWLSAGHLPPLVVTDEVTQLAIEPALPLGMIVQGQASEPVVQEFALAEGEALVLYSDGVIENAAEDDGLAVGEQRFHRALLDRIGADGGDAGHRARAVVEDLLAITGPMLRDDATLLMVDRCPQP